MNDGNGKVLECLKAKRCLRYGRPIVSLWLTSVVAGLHRMFLRLRREICSMFLSKVQDAVKTIFPLLLTNMIFKNCEVVNEAASGLFY